MLRKIFFTAVAAAGIFAGASSSRDESNSASARSGRQPRQQRCDPQTERTCVRCAYRLDGSPAQERYCAPLSSECPPEVCCDFRTEETCFNRTTWHPVSCARLDEGGCPCPEGEVKCGFNDFSSGYCTSLCCNFTVEETCYNATGHPVGCIEIGTNQTCPEWISVK
ncbi:hypothetical protein ACHAWF_013065 [Thalassiosira exigua]